MSNIPVIDFEDYQSHDFIDTSKRGETLMKLGIELKNAFETSGFCFIVNHGIDSRLLEKHFNLCWLFFDKPKEEKILFSPTAPGSFIGWIAPETEWVVKDRPAGLRESFNFFPSKDHGNWGPAVHDLIESSKLLVHQCTELARRVLTALSAGLHIKSGILLGAHAKVGQDGNSYTCLKSLYYPPILEESSIQPNQIRIGEHSDFGSLTILFQDNQGGLEVEIPGQGFVPATPIPGTAVVNIGDLMQRWSADKLLATRHRVNFPDDVFKMRAPRQSVAFFMTPDDDVVIKCLDGSGKYEEVTASTYLNNKIAGILNK